MYSGITQGLYPVVDLKKELGLLQYDIALPAAMLQHLKTGMSVNVDGVCQTVVRIQQDRVHFQAMQETLEKTTLRELQLHQSVSIERSLRYGDEMGGHDVYGHVIGTASVIQIEAQDNNLCLQLACPAEWMKYILYKGFIAVNGSSLTVGAREDAGKFKIHLIPETLRVTRFGQMRLQDLVNIELDPKIVAIVDTTERYLKNK